MFSFNGVMQANVGGGNWATALEVSLRRRRRRCDAQGV